MEAPRIYQQSAQDEAADWLPPGKALAQFEPPEGAQLAAASELARQDERVRYGFSLGALGLLIPLNTGSEVLEMPPVASIPGTPRGFLGLINLRGNLVPLYELRTLLHLEPRKAGVTPLALVFDQGENAVGVIVDDFPQALPGLRPMASLPPLPDALLDHVPAGYMKDGVVWLEFDLGSFFDEASRGIKLQTI